MMTKRELEMAVCSGAYLRGASLRGADLNWAALSGAVLNWVYLSGASLNWADLRGASLRGADLRGADLRGADLRGADLSGAHLRGADLRGADLGGANLNWADLRGVDMSGAKNVNLDVSKTRILPEGALIGWKKCSQGVLVKLRIPEEAKRSHSFGRKCRAEYADVLEVLGADEGVSFHDDKTVYRVGERVVPDSFDLDWLQECAPGIHFFITREEAEAY
jgi:hypothetical protein